MKFTTPNTQRIQAELLAEFPDAQFGTYLCRHISSNPLKRWSQHAASEPKYGYRANALDITHRDHGLSDHPEHVRWLIEVAGWLVVNAARLSIRQVLAPPRRDHKDHVHVDCHPRMRDRFWYKPPCKGGKLRVVYADGSVGDTFGALGGEEMTLKRGDQGNAVRYYQQALLGWDAAALPRFGADADFGGETETWVVKYQDVADLDQTGEIDGVTGHLLGRYHPDQQPQPGPEGPQGPQGETGWTGPRGADGGPGPQPTSSTFGYD